MTIQFFLNNCITKRTTPQLPVPTSKKSFMFMTTSISHYFFDSARYLLVRTERKIRTSFVTEPPVNVSFTIHKRCTWNLLNGALSSHCYRRYVIFLKHKLVSTFEPEYILMHFKDKNVIHDSNVPLQSFSIATN